VGGGETKKGQRGDGGREERKGEGIAREGKEGGGREGGGEGGGWKGGWAGGGGGEGGGGGGGGGGSRHGRKRVDAVRPASFCFCHEWAHSAAGGVRGVCSIWSPPCHFWYGWSTGVAKNRVMEDAGYLVVDLRGEASAGESRSQASWGGF
jgi:hypothetical protein